MRGRKRPLSLGLLVTVALITLPAGAGLAAVSLTAGGVLAGQSASTVTTHSGGSVGSGPSHAGGSGAAQQGPCSGRAPARLHLKRLAGSRARLSWSAPAGARGSSVLVYRVLRGGRTVGQTFQSSIVLAVVPGRHTTFAVQARYGNGTLKCTAQLSETVRVRTPGGVPGLKVLTRTATGAVIGWRAAHRGDAPIAGYRVSLDGAVSGQTRSLRYTLILSSSHSHRVTVTAVDTRDRLGTSGRALLIKALGRPKIAGAPPSMPEGLSAAEVSGTEATVLWLPSKRGAAPLSGYRVYRNGTLVGQTSSTSLRLTHLAFPQTYVITVAAVDTDGAESAHSGSLKLTTAHPAPTPPSLLSATNVSDTSATLSWQAGTASDGSVNGYLLFENGAPEGFVAGQVATVGLASSRSYTFSVRTRDSDGYLSAPSADLTVVTTHTPPAPPQGLVAAAVTSSSAQISWQPSAAVSGNIVGYRLFRNGIPVGQGAGTERTLEGLAAGSEYTITVSAVDSMGAISEPSQPLALATADPPPTDGNVQAFLLASTDESFQDLQAHYQQIGVLYPTYFQCGPGGTIEGKDDPLVTHWATLRKIEVLPRVNCLNVSAEEAILNQPSVRQQTIEQLAEYCRSYGYSGIQIDFENAPPAEREPFTTFITMLAEKLHAQGDKLSTVLTAKYWNVPTGRAAMYNDAALSGPSDYLLVMDWGYHWVTSGPGSIDEYQWFTQVAKYTATMPNLHKFVLAMPLYGVDWPNGGGPSSPGTALQYSEISSLITSLGITPEWENSSESPHFSYNAGGVAHQVWYVNQHSLEVRSDLANSLGMKLGLWRLGKEDQTIWQLPLLGGGRQLSRSALLAAALAAVLGWAASASAGAAVAPAAAARHHGARAGAQAFLLTSSPDSLTDLRAHAGAISVLYPTYFECTPGGGGVSGADVPAIDSFAHSKAIPVMPRFNCQDGAVVHRLLSEPGPRAELLAKLAALARRPAFAGLVLDLENDGPEDREALSSFVAALAEKLHRHHRRLAVVVDGVTREGPGAPYAFYDDRALSAAADTVFVLAWGTHWAGSAPGSISTLPFVSGVVGFLSTLPERSRFVIGAPMYGLDWAATAANGQPLSSQSAQPASAFQYPRALELAHSVGAHAVRDPLSGELSFSYASAGGVTHDVWYMDAQSVLDMLRIARQAGFQVGLWRLGSEDQSLWSSPLVKG